MRGCILRVLLGLGRMLLALGVVILAVLFGRLTMRLGCVLVMLRCLIVCLLGHDRFLFTGECRGPQMALQTCSRKENRRVYSGMELLLSGLGELFAWRSCRAEM
jgi:hypothetical protein